MLQLADYHLIIVCSLILLGMVLKDVIGRVRK